MQYLACELASQHATTYTRPLLPQVTKLVRSGEVGGEERRRVFDAVGFSFINRLLATRESPSDSLLATRESPSDMETPSDSLLATRESPSDTETPSNSLLATRRLLATVS